VFGIAVYYLWRSLEPLIASHRRTAVTASICTLAFWPVACFELPPFPLLLKIVPPSVVLALLVLHSAKLRIRSQHLIDFGGASYSLYLIHIPVLETMRATSAAFPILELTTPIGAVIAILISCLVAMVSYYKLEMPLLRYLHSRFRSKVPWKIADQRQIGGSKSAQVAMQIAQVPAE
jgi:exopolysaccharide production protein ExoZ